MKKSEKIISAVVLMALGILFIVLQDEFVGILMTVAGVSLLVLGIVDIFGGNLPQAIVKMVAGLLVVIAGWTVVEAVLYILAGILLVCGTLWLYSKIKNRDCCDMVWQTVLDYAAPSVCILLGFLFLFHHTMALSFVLVTGGILIILEGGMVLFNAFAEE